jgi:hypothetical protein
MADNPFPAIVGRVCYRPYETAPAAADRLIAEVALDRVDAHLGAELCAVAGQYLDIR